MYKEGDNENDGVVSPFTLIIHCHLLYVVQHILKETSNENLTLCYWNGPLVSV